MTRSDLIDTIAAEMTQLPVKDIEASVKIIVDAMVDRLAKNQRIEIRGFGSFSLHHRKPRTARNPRTGEKVVLAVKHRPHFKVGKELRERVNKVSKA